MKRLTLLFLLIIVIIGIASCSSKSDSNSKSSERSAKPTDAKAELIDSFKNLEKAGSYKLKGTIRMQGEQNGESYDAILAAEGFSSVDGKNSSLKTDMTDLYEQTLDDATGLGSAISESRAVDGILYTKSIDFGFGSSWTEVGPVYSQSAATSLNPSDILEYLEESGKDIKKSKKEKIDGATLTKYTFIIDSDILKKKLRETLEKEGREESDIKDNLKAFVDNDIPVSVWVDEDGMPQRFKATADDETLTVTADYTFYDFGTEVKVEKPIIANPQM